jgi:hypothetical protein
MGGAACYSCTMRWLFVAALSMSAACSDKASSKPIEPVPASTHGDAGVKPLGPVLVDPGDMHLDDDVAKRPVQNHPTHPGKQIDIILRSSPTGATAAVDGVPVGLTPAYWSGMADGREHEFTFVLADHAVARYRFVPISSGVIHARLTPVSDDVDAGVPPELQAVPITPTDAAAMQAPPPPPTVVAPAPDAAIAPTAPVGPQP